MVEEKATVKKAGKPSNLHLERSLSIRSQTSDCCNADLSPGVPNNEKRPNFHSLMSVEQRNSLLKPSADACRDSAALNMATELEEHKGFGAAPREEAGGEGVPVVDNIRNHMKNKDTHVIEMAESLKQKRATDGRQSPAMSYGSSSTLRTSNKSKLKLYACLAIAFVIMLLLISAILTGVFFSINQATFRSFQHDINDLSSTSKDFCVPCDDLRLSSDPIDDVAHFFTVYKPAGGTKLCCASTSEQIQKIIDLRIEKKLAEERVKNLRPPLPPRAPQQPAPAVPGQTQRQVSGPTTTSRPLVGNPYAAQVYLKDRRASQLQTSYSILHGWDDSRDTAFVKKGIQFDRQRGRFIIQREGIYHVSLSLAYFREIGDVSGEVQDFHTVLARDNVRFEQEDIVFSNMESRRCDAVTREHYPCYTAALSGDVRLRAGDELFVKVLTKTVNDNLDTTLNKESDYFGIHYVDFNQ